ncbi:MAG TPA: hypothetical protein VGY76_15145 [Solirubrobacteraceae bacterium]|jgi:hypothetical protein|nr:hypothetical protein [Solirubrobacteraceae bacterium]
MTVSAPAHRRLPGGHAGLRAFVALLLCGVLAVAGLVGQADARHPRAASASAHGTSLRAHGASALLAGIGDEQAQMFSDPNWQRLHTKIARYIAPYDAAVRPYSRSLAAAWIRAAEAQHQRVLVAFYHSEYKPYSLRMPSVATYQRDVQRFIKMFPHVHDYQTYNEANRGEIRGALVSPSAALDAQYYRALRSVCHGCTVVGLDVLDAQNIGPTLEYIAEFKHEVARLHTTMPSVWGLHNYSDTNRRSSSRTRAVLAAVPGTVWLTETGGIVKFGGAFPNVRGSGLRRAASAISYMFSLAGSNSRITRLYIYDWSGGSAFTRFDAGLTDVRHVPRPGYVVVCRKLRALGCGDVKISSR